MKQQTVRHLFVEYVPEQLEDGVLYVSLKFGTAIHRCCCGCGSEVVTPLSPTDWKLMFDGETVSLDPSIGNWSLPCRSHYWIRNNHVIWSKGWTTAQIAAGRVADQRAKEQYYGRSESPSAAKTSWRTKFKRWLRLGKEDAS